MHPDTKTRSKTQNSNANMYYYICGLINIKAPCWVGDAVWATPERNAETQTHTRRRVKIKAGREKQADFCSPPKKNTWFQPLHAAVCILLPSIKTITSAEECARRFRVIQRMGNDPYVRHMGHLTNRFMSWNRTDECVLLTVRFPFVCAHLPVCMCGKHMHVRVCSV